MAEEAFLAIDIGTQSARAALLDGAGRVIAARGEPYEMATPRAGWAEQNPDDWWGATVRNLRAVLGEAGSAHKVAAVGTCGQMHGTVPLGREGQPLTAAVQLWCDKRGAAIAAEIADRPDRAALADLAGNAPTAAWSGVKMAWMRRHQPDLYDRAWKILTPKDYVNFRLTGEIATDHTEASGSFLMNAATRRWAPPLIEALDLDEQKLPPIVGSADVIGHVGAEVAALTGLPRGTPVVAGAGDMLCQILGIGVTRPGIASDTTGSSGIISFCVESPSAERRLMNLHAAAPHWIAFGILDGGGLTLKWWRDRFGPDLVAAAARDGTSAYDLLTAEAATIPPGCEGLLFLPYLLGERTLGSAASRGVLFGLQPRHGRAHATRAILEGTCLDLRQSLAIVRASGAPVAEIRTSGGGARSPLWSQIKADVYGVPVVTVDSDEAGLTGAMILAALGVGAFPSAMDAAARLVRPAARFEPDPARVRAYDALFGLFRELHDGLQPLYEKAARVAAEVDG